MLAVFIFSAFYALTVSTTIPKLTVFLVFLCSGVSGALSYFFSGKLVLFLHAEGKSYIVTLVSMLFYMLERISKIAILYYGKNILFLQSSLLIISAFQNFVLCKYIRQKYPWIDVSADPNFEAISQRKAVLIHKLASLVFSSTDVLLLTYLVNLTAVSLYNMYSLLYGMLKSIAVSFSDGFLFLLGQSYKDKQRFIKLFDAFEVFNMAMTFAVFCTGYLLTLPFMRLYTSGVIDIDYIDSSIATLFVCYFLLENGKKSSIELIQIAEKFEETKWHSIVEAAINLSVSVVLTFRFKIYGVLLGTIAGLIFRTIIAIRYASKLLDRSPWITFSRWLRNVIIFVVVVYFEHFFQFNLSSYSRLVMYGIVLSAITLFVFLGVSFLFEPVVAEYCFLFIRGRLANLHTNQKEKP